jgi:hypothetical protein
MTCSGCSNKEATRISYSSKGETCDRCGNLGAFKFSDVFFKAPYFDANITDPVKAPHGTQINSRQHKADVMRANGLKEVGDKRHGSRDRF